MLALDVEWLMGVCWAMMSPADARPEWPLQPDRVFSALAASWGARGQRETERVALEWLEALPPPRLRHAAATPRTVVTTFVPPNDDAPLNARILPSRRRRQPRQFPASVLRGAQGGVHLRLVWEEAEPDMQALRALDALARDTSYIGHSASVVRCRFRNDRLDAQALEDGVTLASPYAGRLAALEELFADHLRGREKSRPERATLHVPFRPVTSPLPCSAFGPSWIVLSDAGGPRPDVRAAATLARTLRRALMAQYPDPLPEWLCGHDADGAPSRAPHLAVVPLSNISGPFADGTLMGLAIVLPRALDTAWQQAATPAHFDERARFDEALGALRRDADEFGENTIIVPWGGSTWRLRRTMVPDAFNLRPGLYSRAAKGWTTVTPIALDRYPGDDRVDRSAEAVEIVAAACANIGLPRPAAVRLHKHAALTGAPSAWPPGGAPRWLGWARPGTLANRPLAHATIEFEEPVAGPVILGAGRFLGLGLCRPVD